MARIYCLLLCLALFAGCQKNEPVEVVLELSKHELVLDASGEEERMIAVHCNGDWTVERDSVWVRTDFLRARGNLTFAVSVDVHRGLDDRSAKLTFRSNGKVDTLNVIQKGKNTITLSPKRHTVPQEGGLVSVGVKSNITYGVDIPAEFRTWIARIQGTRAMKELTFDFSVARNDSAEIRYGYIIFSGNAVKDTIYIRQEQCDRLRFMRRTYDANSAGDTLTVELKTNMEYDISFIPDTVKWLKKIDSRALSYDKLFFSIERNGTSALRSAAIVAKARTGGLADTLHIRQANMTSIFLSQKVFDVAQKGDTISVEVKSNEECNAVIPAEFPWITLVPETRSMTAKGYKFAISANETADSRKGYIVFANNTASDTVYVNQAQKKTFPPFIIEKVDTLTFKMIYVEGDTFKMGATPEQGQDPHGDELPVHSVALTGYYIAEFEVTQGLWKAVMGNNPSAFQKVGKDKDKYPVENVSWNDIREFLVELNRLTGKEYDLPTEAQWEFAARGGKKRAANKYSGSQNLVEVAWFKDNSSQTTHIVGKKKANALGLYDMSGNVSEWCNDRWGSYSSRFLQTDPTGPDNGYTRIIRGGGWKDEAKACRVSARASDNPGRKADNWGFRIVLNVR